MSLVVSQTQPHQNSNELQKTRKQQKLQHLIQQGKKINFGAVGKACRLLVLDKIGKTAFVQSCLEVIFHHQQLVGCIWSPTSAEIPFTGVQKNYQFSRQIVLKRNRNIVRSEKPVTVSTSLRTGETQVIELVAATASVVVPSAHLVAHQKLVNFTQTSVVDSISLGKVLLDTLYLFHGFNFSKEQQHHYYSFFSSSYPELLSPIHSSRANPLVLFFCFFPNNNDSKNKNKQ